MGQDDVRQHQRSLAGWLLLGLVVCVVGLVAGIPDGRLLAVAGGVVAGLCALYLALDLIQGK